MFKFVTIFCALLIFFISAIWHSDVYAQGNSDFVIDAISLYEPDESGDVSVSQDITLTNTKEFVYAPSYSINLKLKNIKNIKVSNSKGSIPYTLQEGSNNAKVVTVAFPERVVGVGKKNSFTFSFSTTDYLKIAGSRQTVSIPAISNIADFNTYTIAVNVPESFGRASVVKPNIPYNLKNNLYEFSKQNLSKSGISMIFGDKQFYRFDLSYPLENNNVFPVVTEIALPSNTAYQRVLLSSLLPKPSSVYKDKDGNTLAKYSLKSKTKYVVKATLFIESFIKPISSELNNSDRKAYIRPQKYWEAENPEIKKVAKSLKTPEDIYNYVVKALSYDTRKTSKTNERLGALNTLKNPFYAACLEFTDLFVALARSSGIPARAVEGYAYTKQDPMRPVALFQDVLHAWPEYYSDEKKTWIMIDPTWADTTGGIDFFHVFDFDHVAFVKNGFSSTYPISVGSYKNSKTKDVEVSFANPNDFKKIKNHVVKADFYPFAQNNIQGNITYLNLGNYETHPKKITVYMDGVKKSQISFPDTPPLGSSVITIRLEKDGNFLDSLTNPFHTITMQDENNTVLLTKRIQVFPMSILIAVGGGILIGSIIIFIITIKTRGLPIFRRKR